MIRRLFTISLFTFFVAVTSSSALAQTPVRFGIVGDSNSDEYQADDNRGGSYSATTLNWAELLSKYKGFDLGAWGCRAEPRRCGFEYNWARSGANTADYVARGQHTGIAAQVKSGAVEYVFVQASENDVHAWNGTYDAIYSGTLTGTALTQKIQQIISNTRTIVQTIQANGNAKIVISTFNDKSAVPTILAQFPDSAKRQRVTNAVASINQGLLALATEKNLGVFNIDAFTQQEYIPRLNGSTGTMRVGSQTIILTTRGDEPKYFQLGDSVGHGGTVASGLYANGITQAFNQKFQTNWTLFTDTQILQYAGLVSAPSSSPVPTACAEDINKSGRVDLSDYSIFLQNFLKTPIPNTAADINKDGFVNLTDFNLFFRKFLQNC